MGSQRRVHGDVVQSCRVHFSSVGKTRRHTQVSPKHRETRQLGIRLPNWLILNWFPSMSSFIHGVACQNSTQTLVIRWHITSTQHVTRPAKQHVTARHCGHQEQFGVVQLRHRHHDHGQQTPPQPIPHAHGGLGGSPAIITPTESNRVQLQRRTNHTRDHSDSMWFHHGPTWHAACRHVMLCHICHMCHLCHMSYDVVCLGVPHHGLCFGGRLVERYV